MFFPPVSVLSEWCNSPQKMTSRAHQRGKKSFTGAREVGNWHQRRHFLAELEKRFFWTA